MFVSWNLLKAGATKHDFKFAERHAIFMNWAIHNADQDTGSFRGHPIEIYSPQLGDIVVDNQPGHSYDFAYARQHDDYHSHSAIVIERGHDHTGEYILTVGGNEGDSVREKIIYLKNGLIPQRNHLPFIGIIEDRM